ncbi:hypothetical protein P7C71_g5860, partial [Lecanoromycetidae sp. Uapishka_2]
MSSLSRRACYKCGNVGHYAAEQGPEVDAVTRVGNRVIWLGPVPTLAFNNQLLELAVELCQPEVASLEVSVEGLQEAWVDSARQHATSVGGPIITHVIARRKL